MWKIKEWFLHYKEAIRVSLLALFRWTLLAVCTGVLCGGIGTLVEGFPGEADHGLHLPGHGQQAGFQFPELVVEVAGHQPNLPLM